MNRFVLIIVLCFTLFLSACSRQQEDLTFEDKIKTEDENVYKIAVVAPQFGPYRALGLSIVHGAELAVDLKNQSGGIDGKEIKLVKVDDGGLAGEGTWRARSLVSEMVLGVIGHLNSDISIRASEIYSMAMVVEISPGSTNPIFTEREPVRGYVFRTVGTDYDQGKMSARFVLEKGFKKVAVLYNDRVYGLSLSSEFIRHLGESLQEAEIVFKKMYEVGSGDFSSEIASLKGNPPELVFFVGEYGDAANFLRQAKKSELEVAFLGSEGVFDQEFIDSAKEASEGAFIVSLPETTDKEFVKKYKEKFGKEIGSYSANSFDATNVLISAIEKVKEKDTVKIAQTIGETMSYKGLIGDITFDEKGDLTNPRFSIYEVKGGKFVVVR